MPHLGPVDWIMGYLAVLVGLMAVFSLVWWSGLKPLPGKVGSGVKKVKKFMEWK
uniref:ATP synthase subunit 8 n=1 Tax=Bryopa lata TaxID=1969317 RepID=A0A1U9XPE3_9BIVA|nr:ATP synthase F0 subunit 8 [Bryopa lata]AQZ26117.1 ATP synthase subunit 8 [Bryopa lata]